MVVRDHIIPKHQSFFSPPQVFDQNSFPGKKRLKGIKTCPICHKTNLKGKKALQQHIRAKHPQKYSGTKLKKPQPPLQSIKNSMVNSMHCPICRKNYPTPDQVYDHYHQTHKHNTVILDENLSACGESVQTVATLFSIIMVPLPIQYHGKPDNSILDYLISMNVGLITRDKYFAKKAMLFISPVFLIWKNSIIKMA